MNERAIDDAVGSIQFLPKLVLERRFAIGRHVRRVKIAAESVAQFLREGDRINFGFSHKSLYFKVALADVQDNLGWCIYIR
jgi:hypothetical protein